MPKKTKASRTKAKASRTPRTTRRTTTRATTTTPRAPKPQTLTPYLVVSNGTEALDWYQKAFGAKVFSTVPGPGGKVMHAGLTIGQSQLFLSDAFPGSDITPPTSIGGTTVNLHLQVRDADKVWQRATQAGAKVAMPLEDQFWGDRYGKLTDPFGHSWAVASKSKLSKAQLEAKRAEAMKQFEAMAGGAATGADAAPTGY